MYYNHIFILTTFFYIALAETKFGNEGNVLTPCNNDDFCNTELPGSKCIKNVCVCQQAGGCDDLKIAVVVRKIGWVCKTNSDCLIDNAKCVAEGTEKRCRCIENTIASEDEKSCLPLSGLNMTCQENAQCSNVEHSECSVGVCKCKKDVIENLGSCRLNKTLGDSCRSNDDCILIHFSECFENICACAKGFVRGQMECLVAAQKMQSSCTEDIQCTWQLGSGVACMRNFCECVAPYFYKPKVGRCTQHLFLSEDCIENDDCWQNPGDIDYLECLSNVCHCKKPYQEFEHNCIHVSSEDCTENEDCWQNPDDMDYSECLSNACHCKKPSQEFEHNCPHATASTVKFFLSTLLSFLGCLYLL